MAVEPGPGREEAVLRRIKKTAGVLAGLGAGVAFALSGALAALSLTIGAAVVIFNFYVLEKVTGKLLTPRTGYRVSDFAVPAGGAISLFLLLGAILKWKAFNLPAGLAGLSVIVVAIGVEAARGLWR